MWNTWWVWIAGGVILVILEVLMPIFWFLGFAIGALIVGLLLAIGGPFAGLADSPELTILLFAIFSLISWLVIRRVPGARKGQAEKDVNDG